MKFSRYIFLLMFLGCADLADAQKPVSAVDELRGFYDIGALPSYRGNTYQAQVSSYDTTGGNNDGFDGLYSFIRRNADSSLVIFDVRGAGVVNRIWTPTPTSDTLDLYIDDAKRPSLSINYMDLFSGKVFPFVRPVCGNQLGGYYCYYPILFQKHCVIVSRGKKMLFHQIGYRLYEKGTKVQPFTAGAGTDVKEALAVIGKLWENNKAILSGYKDMKRADTSFYLKSGEAKQVFSSDQGGRIAGIEIGPAGSFASLNKSIVLRISWDDEQHAAIDVPVADFFGFAFGKPSMQGLLIGAENNTCYSYIPMPFDKKARVELVHVNDGLPGIDVRAKVYYSLAPRDPKKEGRFYAWRNSQETRDGEPHVFLNIKGKGHYIGSVLQAQGLHPGMTVFFEGDDSTVIDGEMRFHGTGSEDYFNGGWYGILNRWDSKLSLPLHGALDYSLAFSRTGGYRFYLADKMSFGKSIYQSIEHGGEHNGVPGLYTSVSYFYCNENPLPAAEYTTENTRVHLPDTFSIYPQFSGVVLGEDLEVRTSWDSSDIGQAFHIVANDNSMLKINMDGIPAGNYKLFVTYVEQTGGCAVSVWQRQTQISGPVSSAGNEHAIKEVFAGNMKITDQNNSATFRFHTTAEANRFLWRKLTLVKIPE